MQVERLLFFARNLAVVNSFAAMILKIIIPTNAKLFFVC